MNIPPSGTFLPVGALVTIDLLSCQFRVCKLCLSSCTYLEKRNHGLKPTNHSKINPILERRHDHDPSRQEEVRMFAPCVNLSLHHFLIHYKKATEQSGTNREQISLRDAGSIIGMYAQSSAQTNRVGSRIYPSAEGISTRVQHAHLRGLHKSQRS